MKNNNDMRPTIEIVWLISFIVMWLTFSAFIPEKKFNLKLNEIEKSVSKQDWKQAEKSMKELKSIYNKRRVLIQANNATEILTTFDYAMGELELSIQHEQDAALEHIGGLRSTLDFVLNAFSGP